MSITTGIDRPFTGGTPSLLDGDDIADDTDTDVAGTGIGGAGAWEPPDTIAQRESSRFEDFYRNRRVDYPGEPPSPVVPYEPGERVLHEDPEVDFTSKEALEEAASVGQPDPDAPGKQIDVVIELPEDLPFVEEAAKDAIDYYKTFTNVNLIEGPVDPDDHPRELIVIRALDDWSGTDADDANAAMLSQPDVGYMYVNPVQNDRLAEMIEYGRNPSGITAPS